MEASLNQNSIAFLIGRINENLKSAKWVMCPSCSVEWTKLRECRYLNDRGRLINSYLCNVCAETLVAWQWLMAHHPIPGAESVTRWSGSRLADGLDRPQNAYVIIHVNGTEIVARSQGIGPIKFKYKGADEEHLADNIFALRSKIINTVPF